MLLLDDINRRRDRNYCDQILLIKKIRKITRAIGRREEENKLRCGWISLSKLGDNLTVRWSLLVWFNALLCLNWKRNSSTG